jgi:hypothetical protein
VIGLSRFRRHDRHNLKSLSGVDQNPATIATDLPIITGGLRTVWTASHGGTFDFV